ncbi:DUF4248 domain-containing protein [Phocaeicola sp.]
MKEFKVKCYRKSELAYLYFPDLSQDSGVQKLMRWIKKCTELYARLQAIGYNVQCQCLSVQEVRLIVEYLGEPYV